MRSGRPDRRDDVALLGVAALAEADDGDPAVREARTMLRRMHEEVGSIDVEAAGASRLERRALRLLLDHLAAGFLPAFRGTA